MIIKEIKTETEYEQMLDWIDTQLDINPDLNTKEGKQLQIALSYIKIYEDAKYSIPLSMKTLLS